jgi:hypothetical protein
MASSAYYKAGDGSIWTNIQRVDGKPLAGNRVDPLSGLAAPQETMFIGDMGFTNIPATSPEEYLAFVEDAGGSAATATAPITSAGTTQSQTLTTVPETVVGSAPFTQPADPPPVLNDRIPAKTVSNDDPPPTTTDVGTSTSGIPNIPSNTPSIDRAADIVGTGTQQLDNPATTNVSSGNSLRDGNAPVSNAIPESRVGPTSDIPDGGDEFGIVGGETDRGTVAAGEVGDTFKTNLDGDGTANGQTKGVTTSSGVSKADGSSPMDTAFLKKITPKPNPLREYATVTYSASIYLMNAAQYSAMVSSGTKSVAGLKLLIQSGGAPKIGTADTFGAKRNKYFNYDFFLDNIELEGYVSGTSVTAPHNTFGIRFSIFEPMGISLLDRLHAATRDHMIEQGAKEENINYAAQQYLMVIRFYGYDINGNMISGSSIKPEATSDPAAAIEKFIPFTFTNISFNMAATTVEYRCEAVCPSSYYPQSDTHSRIPFNAEVTGTTIKDVLVGSTQDANKKTAAFTGLTQLLNEEQKKLVKTGKQEVANVFKIEFEPGSEIGTKKIVREGSTLKGNTAMMSGKEKPGDYVESSKGQIKKDERQMSFQSGMSILQAIEMIVRNSEYITSQQTIVIDEVTGQPKPTAQKKEGFQWFKIRTQVKPIKYDNKTRDFAYEIKYVVSRYAINDFGSPYFGKPLYRGEHKQYKYWFTGENTEVINFNQAFNYLYYQSLGPDLPSDLLPVINAREVAKRFYQPRSDQSGQGGQNKTTEPAANAASILYSPADQALATLEIQGDPDFIAQSEVFYSPDASLSSVGLGPFMTDGSVNYDASEVVFSLEYNTPEDYDETGLMAIGKNNPYKREGEKGTGGSAIKLIYRANKIVTQMRRGAITQTLEGTLLTFTDDQTVTATNDGLLLSRPALGGNTALSATQTPSTVSPADTNTAQQTLDDDALFAQQDAIQDQVNIRSAESIVAEQNSEFTGNDSVPVISTEPLVSVPATTKVVPTVDGSGPAPSNDLPASQPSFPIPQPDPLSGIPSDGDVNYNTLQEGEVVIVRNDEGQLEQVQIQNGQPVGIASTDEDGNWYEI